MDKIPMTVEGEKLLRDELHELKTVKRPLITEAIKEAREKGDLKENAEYHAAREQQSFAEGRIKDIEGKLSNSHVIDISKIPASDVYKRQFSFRSPFSLASLIASVISGRFTVFNS